MYPWGKLFSLMGKEGRGALGREGNESPGTEVEGGKLLRKYGVLFLNTKA